MATPTKQGTPSTSGWGGVPSAVRARYRGYVAATLPAPCTICSETVKAGDLWDLDHVLPLHLGGALLDRANHGPAHRSCNRSSGASSGNVERSRAARRLRRW